MSDEAHINTEVAARVRVIVDALRIAPGADYMNKSAPQIRATAVASARGPETIDGKPATPSKLFSIIY